MGDINIPPDLQWVSYLAGDKWPQGSESGMFRIDDFFKAAAEELLNLEPDLYRVREETISVLFGDTAQVADEQFAMLFGGDYSVSKLADAVAALGDGAGNTGSEIQYSKWSIIIGLAIAAAEIIYSLAMSGPTWGASLSWIPVTEATTTMTFRQLISMVMRRILATGRQLLGRTMVSRELRHQLRHEILQEAAEELGQQALQEGIVAGIQGDHYRLNTKRLVLNGVASTVGGGAGGGTAVPTSHVLGPASSKVGKAAKGVTTLFTAGVAGNMAGAASVGSNPLADPFMMITSSTTSSVGGVRGAGVQTAHGGNSNTRFTHTPGTGSRPPGPSITLDRTGGFTPRGGDGAAMPTGGRVPDTIGGKVNAGFGPRGSDGAAIPTGGSVPDTTHNVNPVAAHQDPPQSLKTPTGDHKVAHPNASHAGAPTHSDADNLSTVHSDTDNPSTPPSHHDTTASNVYVDHGPGRDPIGGTPVADTPDAVTENGPTPAHHNPAVADVPSAADTPNDSKVEAAAHQTNTLSPDSPPVSQVPSHTPANPATSPTGPSHALIPNAQAPASPRQPTAAVPPHATTVSQSIAAPKHNVTEDVSASVTPDTKMAGSPAASLSNTPAARARPSRTDTTTETSGLAVDDQPSHPRVDPHQPAPGPVRTENVNCGVGALNQLSGHHGRKFGLAEAPTSEGVAARAVYVAVNSRADFTTFAGSVAGLQGMDDPRASALLTWSWASDGGRHGGHTAVLFKDGNDVYLYDPHTEQSYLWDAQTQQFLGYWGQDAISQMAVGYLKGNGDAVNALDGSLNELAAADQIGHVQGLPDPDPLVAALNQRVPTVPTEGLVQDAVHDLADAGRAQARARANVAWMARLAALGDVRARTLIEALIAAHPFEIGNAWGIPDHVSHEAIREWLERKHARADELRSKRRLTPGERRFVNELDRIEAGKREVDAATARAGMGRARWVALDPTEFGGSGRGLIVIGDDPYHPQTKVSWHISTQNVDQLGEGLIGPALDQLRLDQQDGPAATIVWIGKTGGLPWNSARHAFYSDVAALRAAREAWAHHHGVEPRTDSHVYELRPLSAAERAALANLPNNPLWVSRDDGPLVIAHRGGPYDRPEQTLAAYEEARRQGADGFEGDAQLTGDQQLVLMHNPWIKLPSGRIGFVHRMDLAELTDIDTGDQHPSSALGDAQGDTRIMTVEQMLQFVSDPDSQSTAVIETKHWRIGRNYFQLEHKLVELIELYQAADPAPGDRPSVVILSFYPESLALIHRLAPGLPTVYHAPPLKNLPWAAVVASHHLAKALGVQGVDHYFDTLRAHPGAVDHAARLGLMVWARPKNELDAQYGRDLGVAWMGSDHPGQTAGWVGRGATGADTVTLPPVLPEKELVHPIGKPQNAVERAARNVDWLKRLSEARTAQEMRTLIDELIETYPYRIGNADGFLPSDRDTANREYLKRVAARARSMLHGDKPPSAAARKHAERAVRIRQALAQVDLNARQAGLDEPLLLAFDHHEFGGDGRAILSFGDDPYHADEVVWLIARQPVDDLGHLVRPAQEQLQQMRAAAPGKRVAVMVWVGNTTLPVRASHNAFFSDLAAFRAVREALAETGAATPLAGNHVRALDLRTTTEQTTPTLWLPPGSDTLVFGHRGAKDLLPENSLAAFRLALQQGANALECDVQLSKDGQVVVVHDPFVNRATEGSGLVSRLTAAQLQELGVPTLAQLLDLVTNHDGPVTLFIETKHYSYGPKDIKLESKLVELLSTEKYRHLLNPGQADKTRVAVHTMVPFDLRRLSRLAPNLPTVLLAPHLHTLQQVKAYIWAAKRSGAKAISFFKTLRAFPEAVDLAHRQGLNVWAGVVHNATEAQYLLDLGVEIIGSNNPAPTLDWLGLGPNEPTVPSRGSTEAQANVGRTAPGHPDAPHREGPRTSEGHHTGEPVPDGWVRRLWNTLRGTTNCGQGLVDYLSELYSQHGRHFSLGVEPSRKGVPARAVYEALQSRAHFVQSYQEVEDWLLQPDVPDGASAVMASRWRGWRGGGHVYAAVKIDGRIYLYDPHTKQLSDWPPHWGERAVGRIAVGFLNDQGIATDPLDGSLGELTAADLVGHVKGPRAWLDRWFGMSDSRDVDPNDAVAGLPDYGLYADRPGSTPRQRILVFGMSWGTGSSGAETLNMELCRGLAEAGHEVYVRAATVGPNAVVPDGVTLIGPRNETPPWPLYSALVADSDWPESVDLVIAHSQAPGLAAVHVAEQRYPDARCIQVVHHLPKLWNTLKGATGRGWAEMAADIYLARRTTLMSGLGPTLADEALQSSSMAGRASIHELRPGLTMAEQPPLPSPDAPERVLLFGRLDDPLKGAQQTARMVLQRRIHGHDTRLVMLGYDRSMLQAAGGDLAALAADPDAVEVRPRTSNPKELQAIIRSATVVVMPSQAEGFGLVATEAIEQGVPVLVASGSGAGRFLAGLPGYGEAAGRFNLVAQDLAAPPSPGIWSQRLDVVLGDLPAAWANARMLQEQLLPFTRRHSAEHLVDAALTAPDPPARGHDPAIRARVRVVDGQVVVYPNGNEVTDHDLILAVADAMETDSEVRDAVIADSRVVFVRQARPMDDFYTQAIEAVFGRDLSTFVTEPVPAAVVSAALDGESDARLQLDAMVKPGIREAMRHVVAEDMADLLTEAAVDRATLPREVDPFTDALPAVLAAYRESARLELLNYFGARPEALDSGTVDQLAEWLPRTWAVELAGFGNANPAATRQLVSGLDHMLRTYPEIVVREGTAITVGQVAGGNGVQMVGGRDNDGRLIIESITVDRRCLFGAIPFGQQLDHMVIGAVGGILVDTGGGIAHAAYRDLLQQFIGLRPELGDAAESAFEIVVREQLGETALPAVTRADEFWGRTAASQRFDANQAARAAVYQVVVHGWNNATDLARALYRTLFAQLQDGR